MLTWFILIMVPLLVFLWGMWWNRPKRSSMREDWPPTDWDAVSGTWDVQQDRTKYPPLDKPLISPTGQVYPKWDHFPPQPKPTLTPEQDDDQWCYALGIKRK